MSYSPNSLKGVRYMGYTGVCRESFWNLGVRIQGVGPRLQDFGFAFQARIPKPKP